MISNALFLLGGIALGLWAGQNPEILKKIPAVAKALWAKLFRRNAAP